MATPGGAGPIGPYPTGVDTDEARVEYDKLRRRVLWTFPSGLYLIGSRSADAAKRNLMTLNWASAGANRNDCVLLEPTLAAVSDRGLLADCETLHLDRGYGSGVVRRLVAAHGIDDLLCSKVRPPGTATTKKLLPLGMRWPIERTDSWLSNFGQLRRNTDRRVAHRLAQLALAIALLITAKLIDGRDRWSPQ